MCASWKLKHPQYISFLYNSCPTGLTTSWLRFDMPRFCWFVVGFWFLCVFVVQYVVDLCELLILGESVAQLVVLHVAQQIPPQIEIDGVRAYDIVALLNWRRVIRTRQVDLQQLLIVNVIKARRAMRFSRRHQRRIHNSSSSSQQSASSTLLSASSPQSQQFMLTTVFSYCSLRLSRLV